MNEIVFSSRPVDQLHTQLVKLNGCKMVYADRKIKSIWENPFEIILLQNDIHPFFLFFFEVFESRQHRRRISNI